MDSDYPNFKKKSENSTDKASCWLATGVVPERAARWFMAGGTGRQSCTLWQEKVLPSCRLDLIFFSKITSFFLLFPVIRLFCPSHYFPHCCSLTILSIHVSHQQAPIFINCFLQDLGVKWVIISPENITSCLFDNLQVEAFLQSFF